MSVTAPGLEKEEATGVTHLRNTATRAQLWKEGGWEQLTREGPRARHPSPLFQLCKELNRHGNKSQSIKFIEGN